MKLRNKKTGEILGSFGSFIIQNPNHINCEAITKYDSLAELNEEWEDYEEPKSVIEDIRLNDMISGRHIVEIDFTKVEEAEKAVEKLKAWKRLKDKGFRFNTWYGGSKNISYEITSLENETYIPRELGNDLDLLFGGEDE